LFLGFVISLVDRPAFTGGRLLAAVNHQTFTVNATIFVARELAASLFQAGDSFVCMFSAFAFEVLQVRQASASEIELGVADALHHALIQVRLFVSTTDERRVLRAAKIATTF
jgi:hypothetical protein